MALGVEWSVSVPFDLLESSGGRRQVAHSLDLETTLTLKRSWPWNDIRLRSSREFPPCFHDRWSADCLALLKSADISAITNYRPIFKADHRFFFISANDYRPIRPIISRADDRSTTTHKPLTPTVHYVGFHLVVTCLCLFPQLSWIPREKKSTKKGAH